MRNGWNVLDFFIVLCSIVSLIVDNFTQSASADKVELLKMLRVLRSLRMISRNEGLKLSVLSLIYSLPGILNVTVVSSLFLLLFGIFFLNILKGKFYYCEFATDLHELIDMNKIDHKYDCINYGGIWKNKGTNFDDIINALSTLFTMSTTEGWVVLMNDAVDSRGIGLQPKRGVNPLYQYVFIVYMIFGSLFITNLFIEVVINTFDKEKRAVDRNDRLTNFQREYIQLQLKCYNVVPEAKIIAQVALRKACI
jgi:voltage-dependent calcium channel T type alpha-1G